MNDTVDFTDENPGEILIKVSNKVSIETNLPLPELNWCLDQAKFLLLSGENEATDVPV